MIWPFEWTSGNCEQFLITVTIFYCQRCLKINYANISQVFGLRLFSHSLALWNRRCTILWGRLLAQVWRNMYQVLTRNKRTDNGMFSYLHISLTWDSFVFENFNLGEYSFWLHCILIDHNNYFYCYTWINTCRCRKWITKIIQFY